MPRDSSGNYTFPAGIPFVTGTAISATTMNSVLSDLAAEVEDSLSRSGEGGMLVPMTFSDGTVSAPGIGFTNDTDTGVYRNSTGPELNFAVSGTERLSLTTAGADVTGALTCSGAFTATGGVTKASLPSVGQQVSTACGSVAITGAGSDSYADVSNLTVTITTTGRPVIAFMQPDGSNVASLYFLTATGGLTRQGYLRLMRDANTVGEYTVPSYGVGYSFASPMFMLDAQVAGTYVYKVQAKVGNTADTFYINNWKLVAYEL